MNRVLWAFALGLACTGCATAVEDAQPPPAEEEPQRNPPRPFSAPWEDPYEAMLPAADEVEMNLRVPIQQPVPFPDPDPNVER